MKGAMLFFNIRKDLLYICLWGHTINILEEQTFIRKFFVHDETLKEAHWILGEYTMYLCVTESLCMSVGAENTTQCPVHGCKSSEQQPDFILVEFTF